jgi:hypothetical protein
MKTSGLIVVHNDDRVVLTHPNPNHAFSRDEIYGDTEDLHELAEDLNRRDIILKSIYTDDNNPLRNWNKNKPLTFEIFQKKYKSILHYFGECTAAYCLMSRCVNPLIRPAIEEIFVEKITQQIEGRDVLNVAVYGIGGFLQELLILTRVVRKLKLKQINIHIMDDTTDELYEHLKKLSQSSYAKSRDSKSEDDDSESDSEYISQPILINDIVDTTDPESKYQKTNYFRSRYAKLCAISEWFCATGFTKCNIYVYDKFTSMINYRFDTFMGIDFVEEFVSKNDIAMLNYVALMTSDQILLACKDNDILWGIPYQYVQVLTIKNDMTDVQRNDVNITVQNKIAKIEQCKKNIQKMQKVYRPINLKDGVYTFSHFYQRKSLVRLLNESETDESILARLANKESPAEIINNLKGYERFIHDGNNNVYVEDAAANTTLKEAFDELNTYITNNFSKLNIQIHGNNAIYWNVLKTKSVTDGLKMMGWTFINVFLAILIGFGRSFEQLFGNCHRRLSGEHRHNYYDLSKLPKENETNELNLDDVESDDVGEFNDIGEFTFDEADDDDNDDDDDLPLVY